jgi:hypothetical protein
MNIINPLPLSERLGEAIKAALLAIVEDGVTYSVTPTSVDYVEDFNVDKLPSSKQLVYWILDGDHKPHEQASKTFEYSDYLSIFAAFRDPVPYGSAPLRKTMRNLIIEDIHRAITKDVTLGGLARNTEVTEFSRDIRIDNTTGWTAVSAFVVITSRETRFQ